jgi:FMN phosphatase YigB (HAD superfamily)
MTDVEIAMSRLRNKEPLADIDYEMIIAVIDHFESMWDEAQGILAQKRKLERKLEKMKTILLTNENEE